MWHFLWVADFDRNFWVMKTSTKRMSVGKSGPTMAPVGSQSNHITTWQLIRAQMVAQKQLCSPFCCVLSRRFRKNCCLGKALKRCAWRHLNFPNFISMCHNKQYSHKSVVNLKRPLDFVEPIFAICATVVVLSVFRWTWQTCLLLSVAE